jgi:hypothetical protein
MVLELREHLYLSIMNRPSLFNSLPFLFLLLLLFLFFSFLFFSFLFFSFLFFSFLFFYFYFFFSFLFLFLFLFLLFLCLFSFFFLFLFSSFFLFLSLPFYTFIVGRKVPCKEYIGLDSTILDPSSMLSSHIWHKIEIRRRPQRLQGAFPSCIPDYKAHSLLAFQTTRRIPFSYSSQI